MRNIIKKSYVLIGFAILFFILKDVDLSYLTSNFFRINFFWFFLALLPLVFNHLLRAYRWKTIMQAQKIKYSIKNTLLMYGTSMFLGTLTPGKIGDFSRAVYLKKDGNSLGKSSLGNIIEKVLDLVFVFVFAALSILSFSMSPLPNINPRALLLWSAVVSFAALVIIVFLYRKSATLRTFSADMLKDILSFKKNEIIFIILLTILDWFFYFLTVYILALSSGINEKIGFLYLSFVSAIIMVISLIPISILNIGPREASLLFFLTPFEISPENIILFSFLIFLNSVLILPFFLYAWLKKPLI